MLDVRVVDSISAVGRGPWEACFPDELEGYDYLLAVERSGITGFTWRYVVVQSGSEVIAAAPAFVTEYALDTTLQGTRRRLVAAMRRAFPRIATLRLACIGSPCTETATLGFSSLLPRSERASVLLALLRGFESWALDDRCRLVGIKDAPEGDRELWDEVARKLDYGSVPGLPVAHLDIGWRSIDGYLACLSPGTRKDMRRKLRSLDNVRIENRHDLGDVMDVVSDLYRETRARADMKFEELTPAYFSNVLEQMGGRAFATLYYAGDELLAANLLLQDDTTLLDKFFCMKSATGRIHNLYFLSWFTNVRHCLERGLSRYQSGQAAYASKLRLGSTLSRTTIYFRHRGALLNGALRLAAGLFAAGVYS